MGRHEPTAALAHAVRIRVVAKYLGVVALATAGLSAAPALVALAYGDWAFGIRQGVTAGLLGVVGGWMARLQVPADVQVNEALTVTALAFLLIAVAMAWPFMAVGIAPVDALFEALSAVTTTGLTTLPSVAGLPRSFLFARSWMQWYGGLGIVVFTVALLAGHTMASRRLLEPGTPAEDLVTTTRIHARRVIVVYVAVTGAALLALLATPLQGMDAVAHGLSAVSTGGFSTFDGSMGPMAETTRFILMAVALAGAISLPLYYITWFHDRRALFVDVEARSLLAAVLLVGTALAALLLLSGAEPANSVTQGFLLGLSAQTTTGFTPVDVADLPPGAKALLLPAMAVGASVGSSAGGIKLLRVLILLQLVAETVRRTAVSPHAVVQSRLGGRRLEGADIQRALMVLVLFGLTVLLSWLPFLFYGYDPLDALFEVVSATGTVGLSTGVTASDLPLLLKGILCFDMLAGRVEFVALLVVLYPSNWLAGRTETT